jgi:hypothetical protein
MSEEPEAVKAGTRITYDPKISLNTIVICLTAIGATLGIMDRITTNAAVTAVIQSKQTTVEQRMAEMTAQRFIDRQELLAELREIKSQIQIAQATGKR